MTCLHLWPESLFWGADLEGKGVAPPREGSCRTDFQHQYPPCLVPGGDHSQLAGGF